jgi:RNase P subunit RPR2
MICERCDGLMVRERYDDLELGSAGHEISAWRCLNCGAIVDPVIAVHHQTIHKNESDQLRRQRLKELEMAA